MRTAKLLLGAFTVCGAALCAADVGHTAIGALTRLGLLAGPYLTYNHAAVIPALLSGLILAAAGAAVFSAGVVASAAGWTPGEWLLRSARYASRIPFMPAVALVFTLQLVFLTGMESAEQIAAFGHPLGFGAALGAPMFVALGVHALAAIAVGAIALALSRCIISAAWALARVLEPQRRRVRAVPTSSSCALHQTERHEGKAARPLASRIANRPPPLATSVA